MGLSQRERVIQLSSRDEAGGSQLAEPREFAWHSGVGRGQPIDVASVIVGRLSSTQQSVNAAELSGQCHGATHVVTDIDLGVSAQATGKIGQMPTVAGTFAAAMDRVVKSPGDGAFTVLGNPRNCESATPQARHSPEGCSTPVRLYVTRVGATPSPQVPELGAPESSDPKVISTLYERACFEGSVEGCFRLGTVLEKSEGVPEDWLRAVALYELACDHGVTAGCDGLARVYGSAKGQTELLRRDRQVYLDGCYDAEPSACASLPVLTVSFGVRNQSRSAMTISREQRKYVYEKACKHDYQGNCLPQLVEHEMSCASGNGEACLTLAFVYYGLADYDNLRLPHDLDRSAHLFERACDAEIAMGCASLGIMFSAGDIVAKDEKRGAELSERACSLGNQDACAHFAMALRKGSGVSKDLKRSVNLLEQSCYEARGTGCNSLGWSYLLGEGVTKNIKKGFDLLAAGCEMSYEHWPDTCDSYAFARLNGIGTKVDEKYALTLFENACESGLEESCLFAGFMHLFGRGTQKDPSKASTLFKAGCNGDFIARWEESCAQRNLVPEECAVTGLIWHTGACGEVNRERASYLLAKGCHDGWSWACRVVKEYDRT